MKLVKTYLHGDKSYLWEMGTERALKTEEIMRLIDALYEIEVCVDLDTGLLYAVNGKMLQEAPDHVSSLDSEIDLDA